MRLKEAQDSQQLVRVQKYLQQKVIQDPEYQELLDRLNSLLAQQTSKTQLEPEALKLINQFFDSLKQASWQEIAQRKEQYLTKNNPDQIQKLLNQVPHRCNRLLQSYIRVCKQTSTQQKLKQINPFLTGSLLYQVQSSIRRAKVVIHQETSQTKLANTYLDLVIEEATHKQSIHTYIFDLCEQKFSDLLKTELHHIDTQYDRGGIDRLHQELTTQLKPLASLAPDIELQKPQIPQPSFKIAEQVELAVLRENSRIIFDYHYTQSTWFRLLAAMTIGGIIYLVTQRWFGFILLLVQIINLITGQDTKKIRLRQQTKELKRIVDSRYQTLVRSLSDKVTQEIAIALDNLGQSYQEQIETIAQTADQKLQQIKQANHQTKEKIKRLKQHQQELQSFL